MRIGVDARALTGFRGVTRYAVSLLEALADEFRAAGLDPTRPYLEPHSADDYVFDPTASDRSRPRPPSKSRGRKKPKKQRS